MKLRERMRKYPIGTKFRSYGDKLIEITGYAINERPHIYTTKRNGMFSHDYIDKTSVEIILPHVYNTPLYKAIYGESNE